MTRQNTLKIEPGAIGRLGSILKEHGFSGKALLITDPQVDQLYGATVKSHLSPLCSLTAEYVLDNTIVYALSVAEKIITADFNYIVGLGGGRVLDVCKYAAYVSKIPFVSIPTTLSNDGIASVIAVLKGTNQKPKSLGCIMPSVIVVDTELIFRGPKNLIKAGIGDAVSNYMALLDWDFACSCGKDTKNDFAYLMSRNSLDALMSTEFCDISEEFIRVLANSHVLSGIAMEYAGSSRPVSGSEHLFSHALDYYAECRNLHGIQVALGTVAILKLLRFDYGRLLAYLGKFDVDINPMRLGITEQEFVISMQKAPSMRPNRYTYLNEAELDETTLRGLYKELTNEL